MKFLKDAVQAKAKSEGCLLGLDKRVVHIRSSHSALNTLLQSAGALVCKTWMVMVEEELQRLGLKHGWDGDYSLCCFSHDEGQWACRTPEIAEIVARVARETVTRVGEVYGFRCRLNGESKIGTNWSQTH